MILQLLCWLQCQEQHHSMIHILVFSVVHYDQSLINITQLLFCSMWYSFLGSFEPHGIHSHKYGILITCFFCYLDFSFYDWVLHIFSYFVTFLPKEMVGVVCKHTFGYSVFNSFCCRNIILIFITLLTVSSEWIVILIYNYFILIELSLD